MKLYPQPVRTQAGGGRRLVPADTETEGILESAT